MYSQFLMRFLLFIAVIRLSTAVAAQADDSPLVIDPPATPSKNLAPASATRPAAPPVASQTPTSTPSQTRGPEHTISQGVPSSTTPATAVATTSDYAIREPSQGRPILIRPGDDFFVIVRASAGPAGRADNLTFVLSHAVEHDFRVPLRPRSAPNTVEGFVNVALKVPANAPPGLYDLEGRADGERFLSRRCVSLVSRFKRRFRFVHLSDMLVGDLTAPDFDERLPLEINLLAPEFIVATGNFLLDGRSRPSRGGWPRVLDFLAKFDAPIFVVCGEHDREDDFADQVAHSPVGTLDYGRVHGLLLRGHRGHTIADDADQLRWIDADLEANRRKSLNFLVANNGSLALLDVWRDRGKLADFLDRYNIRLFISGGTTDWDFRENSQKLEGLTRLQYLRTHAASTVLRDGASGVSHYRVIEVDDDRLRFVYPDDEACEPRQHSVPAGRIRVTHHGLNDGRARVASVTIFNGLTQPFANACVWLRVSRSEGASSPVVCGGRLLQALDVGSYWACQVALDLPDHGAIRVWAAASADALPPELPLAVSYDGPRELAFTPRESADGSRRFVSEALAPLTLENRGSTALHVTPTIRLNGSVIDIRSDESSVRGQPVEVAPGRTLRLPLDLALSRPGTGMHMLQVYVEEDSRRTLHTFPLLIRCDDARAEPGAAVGTTGGE